MSNNDWDPRFGPMPNMITAYGAAPLPNDLEPLWPPPGNAPLLPLGTTTQSATLSFGDVELLRAEIAALREALGELCLAHPKAASVEVVARRVSGAIVVDLKWRMRGGV